MPARPRSAASRSQTQAAKATRRAVRATVARPRPRAAAKPAVVKKVRAVRPPARSTRTGAAAIGLTAAAFMLMQDRAHPEIASDVTYLQSDLTALKELSDFGDINTDLDELETELTRVLDLLESARERGYVYQGDIDDLAIDAANKWQEVESDVRGDIQSQEQAFQSQLSPLNGQVSRLNSRLSNAGSARSHLQTVGTTTSTLTREVHGIRSAIQGRYNDIETTLYKLQSRLNIIHWALGQSDEARFTMADGENLVQAVKARWDAKGDDDPEGILFLTDKRLIFERKEKVATKKVLFVTTASEMVHEVALDILLAEVASVKAVSKGLFGHQDHLEIKATQGEIPFHINGQDSDAWATLVERVWTGRIEDEKTSGSALSFADITGELTQADIVEAQNEVNALQEVLMLQEARADLEHVENDVRSLERKLGDVRAGGYAIESDLEGEIAVLASQWERVKTNAETVLSQQSQILGEQSANIQEKVARLAGMSANIAAARPVYMQLKSSLASAGAQAEAAEATVFAQYEDYAGEIEGISAHLDWVGWMLEALATASFQLLATESGVAAAEALWLAPGREPENGVLFLTDQRLLWEDRTGDYELKVEAAIASITGVELQANEEEDDVLVVAFDGNAAVHEGRFDLAELVGNDWLTMVGRARNGDYNVNRAIEIDEAELEKVKNAPTSCPNCSASFTAPVLRGQNDITCEYCGAVTRL